MKLTPQASSASSSRLRLCLTAAAETIIRGGHPWVFAESVRDQNRPGVAGELAVIYDRKDKFLAVGLFDPDSPIRVRVLHVGKPQAIDAVWWAARLDAAVQRRGGLFDERTTGYRLINGESDGWPGLVLDRYDSTFVLKIYTSAWLPRLEEIVEWIRVRLNPERIVLRTSRKVQSLIKSRGTSLLPFGGEGGESSSVGPRRPGDGEVLHGPRIIPCAGPGAGAPVVFLERGLKFESDVVSGQKTGFFLDQRENRRIVESLARGRRVLNAFSFSGGFSLYAARGGASAATDLDISAHALAAAERNFIRNKAAQMVAHCRHELLQVDAFDWLSRNAGRRFDLVVLDPPSLAKREVERAGAIRAYAMLAEHGIKHLMPGGILVACSCSAHVTAEEFFGAVRQSATNSGRQFTELQTTRHAADHPATFTEAEYLKAVYLRFSSS